MKILTNKKNSVATAVSIALMPVLLGASISSYAENAVPTNNVQKAKKKEVELEVIEVTGYRDSIASSLNVKRYANAVIDAITADDIGSFPDDNIAESLQRIPGVSITRNFAGEGESVSIRGFSPGQNLSLINGQETTSSSFGFSGQSTRGFNYSALPSTIIKTTEVHKSSQAYLPEGGVGGTVNVITRKPLNQKENFLGAAAGSLGHNELANSYDPNFSGLASWKISDKFGFLVSLDYSDKETRRDAVGVNGYRVKSFTTADGTEFNDVLVPGAIATAVFEQQIERKTAMATLQYQPNDAIDMTLNFLRSDKSGHNLNRSLASFNHAFKHDANSVISATASASNPNTIETIVYAPNPKGNQLNRAGHVESKFRNSELSSESFNYDIQWLGENLTVKAALGASKASGGFGGINNVISVVTGSSTVSIADRIGYAEFNDADLTDTSDLNVWAFGGQSNSNETKNKFATIDTEYYLDDNFFTSLQFGARYTEANQDNRFYINGSDFHQATDAHGKLRGTLTAGDLGGFTNLPDNYHVGLNDNTPDNFQTSNIDDVDLSEFGILRTRRSHTGSSFYIEEESLAFYAQANFEHDFNDVILRGNFGLRSVKQNTETANFSSLLNFRNADDLVKINNFEYDHTDKGDSNYLLPSANLILDLQNDVIVRGAYSTVITRPSFNQLAQTISANKDNDSDNGILKARKGNADLEAFEADKYDISAEWYYGEASSVSLGAFYYDIKTLVADAETEEDVFNDGRIWTVTQPINVDGGELTGLEAAISHQFTNLPGAFSGLGMQLNYTYIDSETEEINPLNDKKLPLKGLSKSTYNAVLFYSKDNWNARLAYNYRDAYFQTVQLGFPRFVDSIARLTAKVKYRFDNGLSVYIQGNNLTNETSYEYLGDKFRPRVTSANGRQFAVGFNYKF